MESMFDRLGDLLSDALQAQPIFQQQAQPVSQLPQADSKDVEDDFRNRSVTVPTHLKEDFKLLGITSDTTTEDKIKDAYKNMLKTFHPDRQKDIAILQKIAHEKTAQIVEAYKNIQEWISSREEL